MSTAILLLLVAPLVAADGDVAQATLLTYQGSMVPIKDDGVLTKKEFTLQAIVTRGDDAESKDGAALLWSLDESGRGRWPWLAHFGRWSIDPLKRDDGAAGPSLLYERPEGKSVAPLPQLLFAIPEALEIGKAWSEGRLDYRVTGEAKKGGRTCWEIDVRSPYGHKRTLWLEQDSPLVVAVRETVFIGQGEQHELLLELAESKGLSAEQLAAAEAAFAEALRLRTALGVDSRAQHAELNPEQLAKLRAELPKFIAAAAETPLAEVAKNAQEDTQAQKGRTGAMEALRASIVGKPLGAFKLDDIGGKSLTQEALAGKVTVLHFWEYRDSPLEEPYGQVGYLDFLLRSRGAAGVQVIGVNVDEKLADVAARRGSIAAARRLKAFMNLGYNVLLDDGELLKRLGDPRAAGGKLPLFVVVGKDGVVLEYHAGLYDVRPDRGLFELDAVVMKALDKK